MKNLLRTIKAFISRRTGLALIVCAAILLELFSAAQYYSTKQMLEEEMLKKTTIEMTMKAVLVKSMLNTSEEIVKSHIANIENLLDQPDSLINYFPEIIRSNQYFVGTGMAFEPNYYPSKGRLYEPFSYRMGDSIKVEQAASESHDYTEMDFYKECVRNDKPCWSDPYTDNLGNNGTIITYTVPIHDRQGNLAALTGVDLSLKWLSDTLNNRHSYPSSFCILLTDDGTLISHPPKSHPRYNDFDDAVRLINDPKSEEHTVMQSKIKMIKFVGEGGHDASVFFLHMRGKPNWQLAMVSYDKEVFGDLVKLRFRFSIFMLLGFALLGYIVYRFFKNTKRLAKNEIENERLSSELQVAKRIQSEMLPGEVDEGSSNAQMKVKGLLNPAKEVGGDLYDYFVRDEKLFFCIGDVSGKGVPSALVMAVVHSLFRSIAAHESNPARIMQVINSNSCHGNETNMFVTFFVGVLDLPTGKLRYCNAGHDTPLLITDKTTELAVEPHFPLGLFADFKYEAQELMLDSGTTLLLYTDGLTEAMNLRHEQFGLSRVKEVAENLVEKMPSTLLAALENAVHEFVGVAEQSDDLTLLAVQFTHRSEDIVMHKEMSVTNDVAKIGEVNDFVKGMCDALQMSKSETSGMKLAIEEAVVNVMNYAYDKGIAGEVNIVADATSDMLKFVITDTGHPFAPTDAPDVDTTLSAEDRQIGGLGIFLVRQLMDTINYERIDGKNVLTLKKKLIKKQTINNDENCN